MSVSVLIVITNGHQQEDRSIGTAVPLFHYFIISILIVILGIIIINSLTLFILNLSFFLVKSSFESVSHHGCY